MDQNGRDPQAPWMRAVLEEFEGPLLLYATRLLRDATRAEDVVQDTFLKLCERTDPPENGHLPRWLYTVCRNRAMDVLRKESRMTPIDDLAVRARPLNGRSVAKDPARQAEDRDQASHVLTVLAALPVHNPGVSTSSTPRAARRSPACSAPRPSTSSTLCVRRSLRSIASCS